MTRTVVIYHSPCVDGWCCAWMLDRALGGVQLAPVSYGDDPPMIERRDVIVADFSYSREKMIEMEADANSIVVLDHHKTAADECAGLPFCVFDKEKSGAGLVYDWLKGKNLLANLDHSTVSGMETLMMYVQDRDLWKFSLPRSREVNAAIRSYDWNLNEWDMLGRIATVNLNQLVIEGTAIERYRKQVVKQHIRHAHQLTVAGWLVPACHCTCPEMISEIGEELCQGWPFAAIYNQTNGDGIHVSLRSDRKGMDVAEVAKLFGGGGHSRAAGFRIHHSGLSAFVVPTKGGPKALRRVEGE